MLLSDFIIGFHKNMIFVYTSLFLITSIFYYINKKVSFINLLFFGFAGALIFFLVSNFGVWLLGSLYKKNFDGMIQCYFLAIPFFKNTLFSTIIFSYAAFFANYFYKKVH